MHRRNERRATLAGGEEGTGLVALLFGVTAFLVLLLFAVQLVVNLYAASTLTAVAFDAAAMAAGAGSPEGQGAAEAHALSLLDGYAEAGALSFDWRWLDGDGDGQADVVELHFVAEHPNRFLPDMNLPFARVERTIQVRVERVR